MTKTHLSCESQKCSYLNKEFITTYYIKSLLVKQIPVILEEKLYILVFSFNETIPEDIFFKKPGLLIMLTFLKQNGRILKTLKKTASVQAILVPL